jgi:hypothetical protein
MPKRRRTKGMSSIITNIIFTIELADYLDQQVLSIRQTTGNSLNRSKLLRGIVAGLKNSPMDFSNCRTEKKSLAS